MRPKIFSPGFVLEITKVHDRWKFHFKNWDIDIMKCFWNESFIVSLYFYDTKYLYKLYFSFSMFLRIICFN